MSRKPPTKAEAARIERMKRLGCLCCGGQPEVHHITVGGRRLGHWWTLPICPGCHRGVWDTGEPSIDGGRKPFEKRFGTEKELFRQVQARLKLPFSWPESKIFRRSA